MKKILFLTLSIFSSIISKEEKTRELTLKFNYEDSLTDVHYINLSWQDPINGKTELHHGSIVLSKQNPKKIIKNIPQEAVEYPAGIYITRIHAKRIDDHPKSFFKFQADKINEGIKINFPQITALNPTYEICVGPECKKHEKTISKNIYNAHTGKSTQFNLTCTKNCPEENL
jgi:hypothetical protein